MSAPKKRLLAWSDSPLAGTGFGRVSRMVLSALQRELQLEISHLAMNYFGEFYSQSEIPWQVVPAHLLDRSDPHGRKVFLEHLRSGGFDYIWIQNDLQVLQPIAHETKRVLDALRASGSSVPKIVYYYPVDGELFRDILGFLEVADRLVTYSRYGLTETLRLLPSVADKISSIPLGLNTDIFRPSTPEGRRDARKLCLEITDDQTFLWINVNRSAARKQLTHTILAFAEFHRRHPRTQLYLHCPMRDNFTRTDLRVAVEQAGLADTNAILFPKDFHPARPLPDEVLRLLYCAADCYITTTLGEGWGLTHLEALACGTPIICPNNSVFPEQLGESGESAFLYECTEKLWVDNAGYRPFAPLVKVVNVMEKAYQTILMHRESSALEPLPQVRNAKPYLDSLSWNNVASSWVRLFSELNS